MLLQASFEQKIEDCIENPTVSCRYYSFPSSQPARKLDKNTTLVTDESTELYKFCVSVNETEVCSCNVMRIDSAVYIQSVEVESQFQGDGIGTRIVTTILDITTEPVVCIYPTTRPMRSICKDNEFEPMTQIDNWFIWKRSDS